MQLIPSEFRHRWRVLPADADCRLLGFVAAWLTAQLLNRYRLSRFFAYPPVVISGDGGDLHRLFGTFLIPA